MSRIDMNLRNIGRGVVAAPVKAEEVPTSSPPQSNLGAVLEKAMTPVTQALTSFQDEQLQQVQGLWGPGSVPNIYRNTFGEVAKIRGANPGYEVGATSDQSGVAKAAKSESSNGVGAMTPEQALKVIMTILSALGIDLKTALAQVASGSSAGKDLVAFLEDLFRRLTGGAEASSAPQSDEVKGGPAKTEQKQTLDTIKSDATQLEATKLDATKSDAAKKGTDTNASVDKPVVLQLSTGGIEALQENGGSIIDKNGTEIARLQPGAAGVTLANQGEQEA
jgi:hypothetical protein